MFYSYLFKSNLNVKTTGTITTTVPDENYGPYHIYTANLNSDLKFSRSMSVLPRLLGVYELQDNEAATSFKKIGDEFHYSRSALDVYNCPNTGASVLGKLKISIDGTPQEYEFHGKELETAKNAFYAACPPISVGHAVARLTPIVAVAAATPLIFSGGVALASLAAANAMPLAVGAIVGGVTVNYLNHRPS